MNAEKQLRELIPYNQQCMIVGKLLGDGNISIEKGRQPRFRFSHCLKDKEWVFCCYEQLKDYIELSSPKYRKVLDQRLKDGYSESYYTQSKVGEISTLLKEVWYPKGKKVLPLEFVNAHLSPLTLAWWYQDDGSLTISNSTIRKIILSTNSFSNQENRRLIEILFTNLHLSFSLDSQNRLVIYDQKQILYFLSLVSEFIHPCMSRKINIPKNKQPSFHLNKRTTITLPLTIPVTSPTKDLRHILSYLPELLSQLQNRVIYHHFFKQQFFIEDTDCKRKSYQIQLEQNELHLLYECRKFTGLTMNQLTELCYILQKNQNNSLIKERQIAYQFLTGN
ncbi:endonuclease [Priestia megaterium]|uniref:endonuclease n=1 Tax=Priestia megaterium TaxID=1404 RepID=UPI000F128BF7|nr:endonuclease [Priestia megaterium]RMA94405.1 LAGLIDADG DNA endonuclease family protein [Priestia megaterium]